MSVKITSTDGISALGGLSARQAPSYFGCTVGIGTYPTEANLEICSALNQQHLYIQGAYDGVGALARIKTISGGGVLLLETGTTSDSRDILKAKNSSGTVLNLQADGMLGIGTEHPNKLLTVAGEVSATGGLSAKGGIRIPDEKYASFGDSQDMLIYHGSGNNWVTTPAGGNLMLQSNGLALRSLAQENYLNATANASVDLYYDNSKKFGTTSTGTVTYGTLSTGALSASGGLSARGGICIPDGKEATFGDASDLRIYHNGSNSYVRNTHTGDFFIRTDDASSSLVLAHGAEKSFLSVAGGRAELRYDDSTKFETTSDGTKTTGAICGTGNLNIDGNSTLMGNLSVRGAVTCIDTRIETTSAIEVQNAGTGPAILANQLGSQPVVDFQDDGTSAFYIEDGGNVGINTSDPNETLTVVGDISATECFRFPGGLNLKQGTNSSLQVTNGNGYLQIGPQNTSWSHFNTDRDRFYFNKCIAVNSGVIKSYDEDLVLGGNHTGTACDVIIKTDDTDRIHVEAAGNVGIGEAVPNQKLTVAGNISASGGLSANGASRFGGCVGIGVSNPDQYLDVGGNIRIPNQGKIVFGSAGTSPSDYLELYDVGTSGSLLKLVQDGSDRFTIEGVSGDVCVTGSLSAGSGCHVSVANSSNGGFISGGRNLADIFVSSSGNIDGSGTTCHVPYFSDSDTIASSCAYFNSATLTNRGAISGSVFCTDGFLYAQCGRFSSDVCIGGDALIFPNDTYTAYICSADQLVIDVDYNANDTNRALMVCTGGKQRARIINHGLSSSGGLSATGSYGATNYFAGAVGIGTNKPASDLQVQDGGVTAGSSLAGLGQTPRFGYSFHDMPTWGYTAAGGGGGLSARLSLFTDGTERMSLLHNGSLVGIGEKTPAQALTVAGNISASGGLSADNGLCVSGNRTIFDTDAGSSSVYFTRQGGINEALRIFTTDSGAWFKIEQDETSSGYGHMTFTADTDHANSYIEWQMYGHSSRLTNTGLGVGTTTPNQKLTVSGNVSALGSLSAGLGEHVAVCNSSYGGFISGGRDLADIFETCSGSVDGSGTKFKIPQWTDADTIGDSAISAIDTGITIDGCVGVKVTDPTSPLHVEGPFTISRTGVEAHKSTIDMDGNFRFAAHSGYSLTFHTDETDVGNTEIVRFRNDTGNVGIGNTEAGQKLTVTGNVSACGGLSAATGLGSTQRNSYFGKCVGIGTNHPQSPLHICSAGEQLADFQSTDAEAYIRIRDNSDSAYFSSDGGIAAVGGSVGANSNNLNVNLGNGNVGIGTAGPEQKLTVAGNISACGGLSGTKMPSYFACNVGIGTNRPQKALEISAAGTSGGGVMRLASTGETSSGNVVGEVQFYNSDTTDYTPGVMASVRAVAGPSGGEGHLQFLTDMPSEGTAACVVALQIHSNANVGIGNTAPNQKLTVSGNVSALGSLSAGLGEHFAACNSSYGGFISGGRDLADIFATSTGNVDGSGTKFKISQWNDTDTLGDSPLSATNNGVGVAGSIIACATDPRIRVEATAGNHPGFEWLEASNRKWLTFNDPANDHMTWKNGSDTEVMELDQDGYLYVNSKIVHLGDTDTFIDFTDDDINIQAGGVNFIDITESGTNEITFNEAGADIDFRVEGDADTSLLFTNAGTDKVGVGTITPNEKLTVAGSISACGDVCIGDDLVVKGESMTVCGATAQLNLCDTTDTDDMWINFIGTGTSYACLGYLQRGSYFDICTNNRDISLLPGTANVGIGNTAPTEKLTINGNLTASGGLSATNNITIGRPGTTGRSELVIKGKGNSSGDHVGMVAFKSYAEGDPLASIKAIRHGADDTGCMAFATSDSERMRIDNDGYVGIGTTAPNKNLTVVGKISATSCVQLHCCLLLRDTGQIRIGSGEDFRIYHSTNNCIESHGGDIIFYNYDHGNDIIFCAENSSGTAGNYIHIDSSANCTIFGKNTRHTDSVSSYWGTGGDLQIQNDSADSIIQENTRHLCIKNVASNGDICLVNTNGGDVKVVPDSHMSIQGSLSGGGGLSAMCGYTPHSRNYLACATGIGYGGNRPQDILHVCQGSIRIDNAGYAFCIANCFSMIHYGDTYFCNNTGNIKFDQDAANGDIIFCGDKGSGKYTFVTMDMSDSILDVQGPVKQQTAINAQTGTTYTLVLADHAKLVTLNNGSAITLTVPPNSSVAFPTGTEITLTQLGAGQVTIAAGSGVTLYAADSELKTRVQYSSAVLTKIASDTWIVAGDLTA